MILRLRVFRAVIGVIFMIMLKACVEPLVGMATGSPDAGFTLLWRLVLAIWALYMFFYLYGFINHTHRIRTGDEKPLLPHVWHL